MKSGSGDPVTILVGDKVLNVNKYLYVDKLLCY